MRSDVELRSIQSSLRDENGSNVIPALKRRTKFILTLRVRGREPNNSLEALDQRLL